MSAVPGVRRTVVRGFAFMSGRLALAYALRLASVVVLARFLIPADYAVFGVVATLFGLLQFAVDLGLTSALVQRAEAPDADLVATVFWAKLVIALGLAAAVWVVAGPAVNVAGYGTDGAWMLRVYALQLPIDTLRTIPAVSLDRRLAFDRAAIAETADLLALYTGQVGLAAAGAHAWSFIGAGVVRSVVGTAVYGALSPWRVLGRGRRERLAELFRFGVPFNAATLVYSLRAMIPAWVVSRYAGSGAAGLVVWSLGIAGIAWPLAHIVDRLMFPAFARAAGRTEGRQEAARALLTLGAAGGTIILCGLVPAAVPLVRLVFGERWVPAASLLPLAAGVTACATLSYLTASVLNGMGKPGWRLAVGGVAATVELVAAVSVVPRYGASGYFVVALAVAGAEAVASLAASALAVGSGLWRPAFVLTAGAAAAMTGAIAAGLTTTPLSGVVLGVGSALALAALLVVPLARRELTLVTREVLRR